MQTFLASTIENILKTTDSFANVLFILPSQRAGVYAKQHLKNTISTGFLPEIITIEQFVERVSGLKKADTIQLLMDFYTVYKDNEQHPVSFDNFSSWAFTVIQDFNEIDQYLIDTHDLFTYLRDIQRLRKWSVKGEFKETELIKDHNSFLEKLHLFYPKLTARLLEHKRGYQGLIFKEATGKIDAYIAQNAHKRHFFMGFNALTKAEEYLFQKVLETQKAAVYWDIDEQFLHSDHQAGMFIRKYLSRWKYYEKNPLKVIGKGFEEKKDIQVIGAARNITQVKHAGEILEEITDINNTAFVLGDESLLPVALTALPKKIEEVNITMGYPLRNVTAAQLIYALFQLFLSQERLQKKETNLFFYKDVLSLLKNALLAKYLNSGADVGNTIANYIVGKNASFISKEDILSASVSDEAVLKTLTLIFEPAEDVSSFINKVLSLFNVLKNDSTSLEREYIYRLYLIFNQLKDLHQHYQYFEELKTLFQFYKQLVASEKLFFQGEPLRGLQLMGMLETRGLDFENVIITTVNEGHLPTNSNTTTFIPFDVKIHFGLPTYKEKDAIFSYHFFRLLQRAKNIFLLYNTSHDTYGSGEQSRFLMQLELLRDDIKYKHISARVITEKKKLKEIVKDSEVLKQLRMLAEKGISPSTLTNYLYNPIIFYRQKILHLKELKEIEETVAANTLGSIIHDTLDELYTPYVGQYLIEENVLNMQSVYKELLPKYFKKHFKSGDTQTGKNKLIYEVANHYIKRFLQKELDVVQKNTLKIIATEKQLAATLEVRGLDFPIKIRGIVDRVDELNGTIRVIDYKTGLVQPQGLRIGGTDTLEDYKYSKAIQVLLYTYLFVQKSGFTFDKPVMAGIISFKRLQNGFMPVNFSEKRGGKDPDITQERLYHFMTEIKQLIATIYDPEVSFNEPTQLPF